MARFANGAVVVSHGNNAVLATVVGKKESKSLSDFVSLSVDFRQSAAAVGRIPVNYLRRELKQTDNDILISRAIDRSLRPLFRKDFGGEVQVICKPLSLIDDGDPLILGINGASAALAVSDIPWDGPVSAVRVGYISNEVVINPSPKALKDSSLNMVVTGNKDGKRVVMIEMDGDQIPENLLMDCFNSAINEDKKIVNVIEQLVKENGKKKWDMELHESDSEMVEEINSLCKDRVYYILTDQRHDKESRDRCIAELRSEVVDSLIDKYDKNEMESAFSSLVKNTLRDLIITSDIRCDGRGLEEFRLIEIKVDVYKKLHGSALFQRGQTQVLGTVTFDSPSAAFHPDSISQLLGSQRKKMFMLHYEFPSFATNEISTFRGANRRELGHGALAEKALKCLVPDHFPYSIRLACQVLESNGSSSMASVCVGSLALLDAGVPLKAPAAGVAIGMVSDQDTGRYKILTDILGIEDYSGDMDFKIAGTSKGITAMQLDLKIPGITLEMVREALVRGRKGIDYVLKLMNEAQASPRSQFKSSVPVIETMNIPVFRKSILFRNGGYNAKLIEAETGVQISTEDDANISLMAPNRNKMQEAKEMMEKIFNDEDDIEFIFGALYKGEIVEILENGITIRLKKGMKPIFMRNSNLDARPVAHASVLGLKVGSSITVQYLGRDSHTGQHRICRKTLQSISLPVNNFNR
uniref:polyribonucleotide nucleotidyltransferase n=1 Tax=Syphacia muris TaxID=451379 RepID=A0A0N5AP52_9BILA